MPGLYSHVSRATGTIVTPLVYNSPHLNHISNEQTQSYDDASANVAAMQNTTDPFPAGVESLATDLDGELRRLRFIIKELKAGTATFQWYQDAHAQGDPIVRQVFGPG